MVKAFTHPLLTAFLMLTVTFSFAQKEVRLQINQFLGNTPFTIGAEGTNNLGQRFSVSRLDYYISSVKLHHDGGSTTNVSDKYIFVSNGNTVDELLGVFNIGVLDSITFSVGVDSSNNHADPTLWPPSHPLAPKSPDMHWGWAAGYRFVAMEGNNGPNLQFFYQIHALGDELYKPTTIATQGKDLNGALVISLDADYQIGLHGININNNIILHGSTKEAISIMTNYNQNVFKAAEGTSAVHEIEIGKLKIYPNPVLDGKVIIELTEDQLTGSSIIIRDALGRKAYQLTNPGLHNEVLLDYAGFYSVELIQSGKLTYRGSILKL